MLPPRPTKTKHTPDFKVFGLGLFLGGGEGGPLGFQGLGLASYKGFRV